jgi:hypothetical protein
VRAHKRLQASSLRPSRTAVRFGPISRTMRLCRAAQDARKARLLLAWSLLWALTVFVLTGSTPRVVLASTPRVFVRDSAAFIITDASPQPSLLYETALRFTPVAARPASTGPYRHAGGEYGFIVSGRVERRDAGRVRVLSAADAFESSVGEVSVDRAMRSAVQLSAFWGPFVKSPMLPVAVADAPKAAPLVTPIFQNRFQVTAVPPTPFTLVEQLVDMEPGSSTVRFSYGGRAFCSVANGVLEVEKNAVISHYRLGQSFVAGAGQSLRFTNASNRLASLYVVVFLPEAEHLTLPHRAY